MTRTVIVSVTRELAAGVEAICAVTDDTSRYGDWVDGVLEVTDHHGRATVGRTYAERNRAVGPLVTRSQWTVLEDVPHERRVDAGTGFAPLRDLVNTFRFEPLGPDRTAMTYEVRFRIGLGPLTPLVVAVLRRSLRAEFTRSLQNLEELVVSEAPLGRA
ncbi:SRPBCC family protein [Nocardioides plantarum]|uniref:SRPBCC family protein n=1 Tax=Nocardioides plantarum TaxID=29299 RepID=A0ABV5KGB9_9ACTN|nr:SRPBCC family protein [Nocardioides plantarum]